MRNKISRQFRSAQYIANYRSVKTAQMSLFDLPDEILLIIARHVSTAPQRLEVLPNVLDGRLGPLSLTNSRLRRICWTAGLFKHIAGRGISDWSDGAKTSVGLLRVVTFERPWLLSRIPFDRSFRSRCMASLRNRPSNVSKSE
jgi:hypothetical protein